MRRGQIGVAAPCAAFALLSLAGCAVTDLFRHKVLMRGSVIAADRGAVVICIGARDGARVRDVFRVYSFTWVARSPEGADGIRPIERPYPPGSGGYYRRQLTGKVRISTEPEDHYANAVIVSGSAQPGDIVEREDD